MNGLIYEMRLIYVCDGGSLFVREYLFTVKNSLLYL